MSESESDFMLDELDDSEPTDPEFDADDDQKTSKGTRSKGKKKEGGMILKDALKVPRATSYSTEALHKQIHNGDIELDPEYQREVVWSEEKQINLIDSLLRNYYIPPVIFSVTTHEDGSERRVCIDGKQRLTSIQKFMDGLIPHRDQTTKRAYYYHIGRENSKNEKKRRNPMPQKFKQVFANKQVVCVEYQDLTDTNERDIFTRVQLGMALTPAEKLRVSSSPRSNFIRTLVDEYARGDTGLGSDDVLAWARNRGNDFRCLSSAIFMMFQAPSAVKTIPALTSVDAWLKAPDAVSESFGAKVTQTLNDMAEILDGEGSAVYRKTWSVQKKLSPVEVVCILYMIYLIRQNTNFEHEKMGEMIEILRTSVRKEFQDIRMNNRVGSWMVDFIKDMVFKGDHMEKDTTKKRRRKVAIEKDNGDDYEDDNMDVDAPSPRKARTLPTATPLSSSAPRPQSQTSSSRSGLVTPKLKKSMSYTFDNNPQRLPSPQTTNRPG